MVEAREGATHARVVRDTAGCAIAMKTRQNTGTDKEDENDLALVLSGPAAMFAGSYHPFENLEQVVPA